MRKRAVIFFALPFVAFAGTDQEFWLQPKKYRYKVGEEMKVDFMEGENFMGELWDRKDHKTEKLDMYNLVGKRDLRSEVKATAGNSLSYKFLQAGTHLLVMQTDEAYAEWEAERFNDYLKENGLDDILDRRKKINGLSNSSKEYSTRFTKVLVQSGDKPDDTYRKKTGLRLEIIPDKNPYSLASGDYLQCQLLFEGKPSAHALIKVWSHIGNRVFLQNIYTENDGTIKFPISNKGPWMISSVLMMPSEKEDAVYYGLRSSLVFGIE